MKKDLDMNDHDIINANSISTDRLFIDGSEVFPIELASDIALDALNDFKSDLSSGDGSDLIGFNLNAITSLTRTQDQINRDYISIMNWIPDGQADGVTVNTAAFQAAITHCELTGRALYLPGGDDHHYLIDSTLTISQYIEIRGESAGLQYIYGGKSPCGSHIKFTGTGPLFYVQPSTPTPTIRQPFGSRFSKLTLEGTSAASHGIKVSDDSFVGDGNNIIAGIVIEDVFTYNFKHGRGVQITWCFNNNIKNYESENCAIALGLHYAHRTTITAGTLEQCLVGLDAVITYDVSLHGTCLEGVQKSREASMGLAMPADFAVWSGWNGIGSHGIFKPNPAAYSGSGIRNLGSVITWIGGYEEGNDVSLLNEQDAHTKMFGRFVDVDHITQYFAILGHGTLTLNGMTFFQGNYPALQGVIHQEKPTGISQLNVTGTAWSTVIPENKKLTGYTGASGDTDIFNLGAYHGKRTLRETDLETVRGYIKSGSGFKLSGGFDQTFWESKTPASTGTATVDLSDGTTGTNIIHIANDATVTFTFSAGVDRFISGVPLRVHVMNFGTTNTTVFFGGTHFKWAAVGLVIPPNKQMIIEFIHSNNFFVQVGTPIAVTI